MDAKLEQRWSFLLELLSSPRYRYRLKIRGNLSWSEWNNILSAPANGYVEPMSVGPILKDEIEAIEIDPKAREKKGKLVPESVTDETDAIALTLKKDGISYDSIDGYLRVDLRL
jgi:hypothetical protein